MLAAWFMVTVAAGSPGLGLFLTDGRSTAADAASSGLDKIQHIVIIMQENRSFDHYFGTYPGADGLPRDANGNFTVCVPDPSTGNCVKPWHNTADKNYGGLHGVTAFNADLDSGKMDGFIAQAQPTSPNKLDVMGYHDDHEVPNPQLLGLRQELRAPRPHVRIGQRREPALPQLHGLGLDRPVQGPDAGVDLQELAGRWRH
jgi:phospholipase C